MRRLLILLSLALLPSAAWAAPAYVGGAEGTGAPVTLTYSSTGGNLLVAGCESYATGATFAISDSATQTWTALTRQSLTNHASQMFYKENSAAVTSVTCTVTGGGGTNRANVAEYSGIATSSALREVAYATDTGNAPSSGNYTVTDGDLVVGFAMGGGGSLAVAGGGTMPDELMDGYIGQQYKINSGTTASVSYTCTWNAWSVTGAGFVPAGASAVETPTFNYGTGTYKNPSVTVTVSDATSGAAICYTTDGATPGAATPGTCDSDGHTSTYSTPLVISSTGTVLKAIGTKAAMTNSSEASATYTLRNVTTFYLATAADGGSDANSGADADHPWLTPNHALLCGDIVQAKASTAYSAANFGSNDWGTVTCIGEQNVAWLKCESFDGCKISATANFGMWINKSYWGVQGWEVAETGDNGLCFGVIPTGGSTIHHIVLANNVCNGGANGFASSPESTTSGVDYLAILSNIVWNAAQSTVLCNSGITVYEPIKSDSASGTHIYIAGNFAFDNYSPTNCLGGAATYDGNGIVLDDLGNEQQSGTAYDQQVAVENNIAVFNGGYGLGNTGTSTPSAAIYHRYNTAYGNLTATNTSATTCGDFTLLPSSSTTASYNLVQSTSEHACSGGTQDRYAFAVNGADATDTVESNWLYSSWGQNTVAVDSSGFSYGTNVTGLNPNFVNPVDVGQPSCAGKTSVVDCMSTVLLNYSSKVTSDFGYQFGQSMSSSTYWPTWLSGVTLPTSVTKLGVGLGRISQFPSYASFKQTVASNVTRFDNRH